MPNAFPSAFAVLNPYIGLPNVARAIKVTSNPPKPTAATIASGLRPGIFSSNESEVSTPTNIKINRNNIITAPV